VIFSPHTLHPSVPLSDEHEVEVTEKLRSVVGKREARLRSASVPAPSGDSVSIDLTTVSAAGTFDAHINVQFSGATSGSLTTLVVDSGNSILIIPDWEQIQNLQGYTVLGTGTEPWGCPANIVQGPILIPTSDGGVYTIPGCVFYACTGAPPSGGQRTANFGAGRPTPWSANGWSTPQGVPGLAMQAPLSYNPAYPYAEFNYAPAEQVFSDSGAPMVSENSFLVLYQSQPPGYTMLNTIQNLEWMSLTPQSLSIEGTMTQWPGSVPSPIAMVDTGGGPVFLSDPNGYVYSSQWSDPVTCPSWTGSSQNCNCISGEIGLQLGDGTNSVSYVIDTSNLPPSVQGITAVLCEVNAYMMNQQGMNIGGISALFKNILVDYAGSQVGFKAKAATTT